MVVGLSAVVGWAAGRLTMRARRVRAREHGNAVAQFFCQPLCVVDFACVVIDLTLIVAFAELPEELRSNTKFIKVRFVSIRFDQFDSIQLFDSIWFGSVRFDSIRFDSIRFDSIRFYSIRFDSIRSVASSGFS